MGFYLNHYLVKNVSFLVSLPARGVWIEIWQVGPVATAVACHSPQGECGLKYARPGRTAAERVTPRKGSVD